MKSLDCPQGTTKQLPHTSTLLPAFLAEVAVFIGGSLLGIYVRARVLDSLVERGLLSDISLVGC